MTDNKPCPFCGDTDISYIPAVLGVISQAYCESCHARGPQTSDSDHFDLWNTRHTPWQPAGNAPKDGTPFIAFIVNNTEFPEVVYGFYNEDGDFQYHDYPDDHNVYTAQPIKWVPRPEWADMGVER